MKLFLCFCFSSTTNIIPAEPPYRIPPKISPPKKKLRGIWSLRSRFLLSNKENCISWVPESRHQRGGDPDSGQKAFCYQLNLKNFKEKNFDLFGISYGKTYHNETEKAESMEAFE